LHHLSVAMLQRAVANAGATIAMIATPSMTDAGKKLAGRGGMPAALARSFREELRRVDTAGDGGAVPMGLHPRRLAICFLTVVKTGR
jgi:hypothetical protein